MNAYSALGSPKLPWKNMETGLNKSKVPFKPADTQNMRIVGHVHSQTESAFASRMVLKLKTALIERSTGTSQA